eukprot:11194951-Lingulodinium_polyedra.AAC.1
MERRSMCRCLHRAMPPSPLRTGLSPSRSSCGSFFSTPWVCPSGGRWGASSLPCGQTWALARW